MPRNNRVSRTMDGKVKIVLNSIELVLTEAAFIEFMEAALNTLQAIVGARPKAGA